MKRALLFACVLTLTLLPAMARGGSVSKTLDIYFIDVEGGAATLLVTPRGESLLVDSGFPENNDRDAKRIYHVATDIAGLKQIDHYLTSHWHLDHYGGIAALSRMIPVQHFWDRGIPEALSEDAKFPERMKQYREISGGRSRTLKAGDTLPLKSPADSSTLAVKIRVVVADGQLSNAPAGQKNNPQCQQHQPKDPDPTDNAKSLGFLLSFGDFDYLCLGDLTWNVEHRLVCPTNRIGEIDLYMVTHHGLNSSNNPVLLHSVRPRVAVACNGPHKGAHPDVIRTLRQVEGLQAIYQLHLNLDSAAEENTARGSIANLDEACAGQFIKATVDPHAKNYTLTIGPSGEGRTFQTR